MMLFLLSTQAFADQLVVLQSEERRDCKHILFQCRDVFPWSDLQRYPIKFSNVTSTGDCSVYPRTIQDVKTSLSSVTSALNYMELDQADGHLLRVESDLRCLNEVVSADLLSQLYFISGLTYYYRQNEAEAKAQWKQAYALNEELKWDDVYEPSGKSLFEQTLQRHNSQSRRSLLYHPTFK